MKMDIKKARVITEESLKQNKTIKMKMNEQCECDCAYGESNNKSYGMKG